MTGLRLLEKLRTLENPSNKKIEGGEMVINSILKHVEMLLRTHRGTVPISEEYGTPDIFYSFGVNYERNSRALHQLLKELISKFETRLKKVSVEIISTKEDLLKQKFRISAVLSRLPNRTVSFIIEVTSEGKFSVLPDN